MKKIFSFSVVVAALVFSGCGEDRSTLYDGNGQKITPSGKRISWIYDTPEGQRMIANNYVYIPGGFDVDGDGIEESGFWLAKYEARESNETLSVNIMDNLSDIIRDHFLIYNPSAASQRFDRQLDINTTLYANTRVDQIEGFHVGRVYFTDEGDAAQSFSPVEAVVAMELSQVEKTPWHLSLPTEKQWMQVVQLVINNKENWTGGEVRKGKLYQGKGYSETDRRYFVIANNLLGNDPHVPSNYTTTVFDLSGNLAEWTRGMVAIDDRFLGGAAGLQEYTAIESTAPKWWLPILRGETSPLHSIYGAGMYYDGATTSGATDTLPITGNFGDVDPYAVVARGGSFAKGDSDLLGVSAAKLNYGPGFKDPTIGFRGASGYVE